MPIDPFIFIVLLCGFIATIVLVVGGLVLSGQVKLGGGSGLVAQIKQRVPELGTLPEDQQVSIVNQATLWPALLALTVLFAFMLFAVSNLAVLNFINTSSRTAGAVGVVLLVLIVAPFRWLQAWIVRRKVSKLSV